MKDSLGAFLLAYDEYLDGKRDYADLPILAAYMAPEQPSAGSPSVPRMSLPVAKVVRR